jgi:hypothetical protein
MLAFVLSAVAEFFYKHLKTYYDHQSISVSSLLEKPFKLSE